MLDDAINNTTIGAGLQVLMDVNSQLDTVFNMISNQTSLGDLSPVVNTARSIELARYIHCIILIQIRIRIKLIQFLCKRLNPLLIWIS